MITSLRFGMRRRFVPFVALSLVFLACGQEFSPSDQEPWEEPSVPEDERIEIHLPPLGTQRQLEEYLLESVLGAVDISEGHIVAGMETSDELRTDGTSRFTRDPVFWFDDTGRGTQGEADLRPRLTDAGSTLTNNLYSARFRDESLPPPDPCAVITISLDANPRGIAYLAGADCTDSWAQQHRRLAGSPITGGLLDLPSFMQEGMAEDESRNKTELVRHELGHVFGLRHAFQGDHMMAYGRFGVFRPASKPVDHADYSDVEKEAFSILYSYPPGTSLDTLIADGEIAPASLNPPPHIDNVMRWSDTENRWDMARDNYYEDFSARPGQYIVIYGARMTLRFLTELTTEFRPPDYAPPEVYFGGIRIVADVSETF